MAISIYGTFNIKGSTTRITLEIPRNILIDQELKFKFIANNNKREYEAFIVNMVLAL